MGIDEGEEVQAKGIHHISNKILAEKFPTLKKKMPTQVQEASRTPNRHDQKRVSPQHFIIKMINPQNKERILKDIRKKNQVTYKGNPIKITTDFSTEILKTISTLGYCTHQNYHSKLIEK
jgi:hypothetical protein